MMTGITSAGNAATNAVQISRAGERASPRSHPVLPEQQFNLNS
jgi:hypothetical protein